MVHTETVQPASHRENLNMMSHAVQMLDQFIEPEIQRVEVNMDQLNFEGRGVTGLALLIFKMETYLDIIHS